MMSCKDISSLISLGQDQKLSMQERIMVRLHLFFCEACSRFNTQIHFIDEAMNLYIKNKSDGEKTQDILSGEARRRLREALDKRREK